MKIYHTNCSETSFALKGTFKQIQNEVLNMVKCVEGEYKQDNFPPEAPNGKLSKDQMFKDVRDEINRCKTIDDLEKLCFTFTCNYETYFLVEDNNTLLVATCNNHDWSDVNHHPSPLDYYKITKGFDMLVKAKLGEYIITTEYYLEKDKRSLLIFKLPFDSSELEFEPMYLQRNEEIIDIKKSKGRYMVVVGNKMIDIERISPSNAPTKIQHALLEAEI